MTFRAVQDSQDQPGPAVGCLGCAQFRAGPAEGLLNSREVCSRSNRRRNTCQSKSIRSALVSATEDHSQTGLGSRSPGRCSPCGRIRVPSIRGSSPVVVQPGAAMGQTQVQPVPCLGLSVPVVGGGVVGRASCRGRSRRTRRRACVGARWRRTFTYGGSFDNGDIRMNTVSV